MARPRASDYDEKRRAILDRSAELFAEHGYDRASMSMIAAACGVSKGLLYHYYEDKDALLFDVIRFHLEELIAAVEDAIDPSLSPEQRLTAMAAALLEAYRDADAEHQVQINTLRLLPVERQQALKRLERELVRLFADAIIEVAPEVRRERRLLKPITMSLFGMLNWHYLWFRPNGPLSRAEYAALATGLVMDGTRSLLEREHRPKARVSAGE
jgi:TetR/AcrR family transcriptional regulator